MKLAIVIPTYWKLDGSTKTHLATALNSIASQTHEDYKVFLIGDKYEKDNELIELSTIIDSDQIYLENLEVAVEREKYDGIDLWRTGGINATNVGVKKAIEEGYNYICHLDHDDLFFPDHLEEISKCIESEHPNFISTRCGKYPIIETSEKYKKFRPVGGRLFKSSTCMNYLHYNMFFRDVYAETGVPRSADADLWDRIHQFMIKSDEWGIIINKQTCKRTGGQDVRLRPEIIK